MSTMVQNALVYSIVSCAAIYLLVSWTGFKPRLWLAKQLLKRGHVSLAMRVRGSSGDCQH